MKFTPEALAILHPLIDGILIVAWCLIALLCVQRFLPTRLRLPLPLASRLRLTTLLFLSQPLGIALGVALGLLNLKVLQQPNASNERLLSWGINFGLLALPAAAIAYAVFRLLAGLRSASRNDGSPPSVRRLPPLS